MTPIGDKNNEDGNSKNIIKVTMTPAMTTEGGERCQHR
jgi:hypothetical protein